MRRLSPLIALFLTVVTPLHLAAASRATTTAATVLIGLGDSYASGEGAPPYDHGTTIWFAWHRDTCHRGPLSWQRLVGVTASNHLACSGATVSTVLERGGQQRSPDDVAQLDRLRAIARRGRVTTILVMVGGNDLGFGSILTRCVIATCLRDADAQRRAVAQLGLRLARLYTAIRGASGGARVIVVGYPDILPRPGARTVGCDWLAPDEVRRAEELEQLVDETTARAAAIAGAEMVSTRRALHGHELCTPDPWVRPIAVLQARVWRAITDPEQGHPNARGQRAIARVVRLVV